MDLSLVVSLRQGDSSAVDGVVDSQRPGSTKDN
jgi:hypothetical protein